MPTANANAGPLDSQPVVSQANTSLANPSGVNANGADVDSLPSELAAAAQTSAANRKATGDRTAPSSSSLRTAHAIAAAGSALSPPQAAPVPPASVQASASSFAHNDAATRPPQGTTLSIASGPFTRETFALLDGDAASGAANLANWTRTGAHSVEAGFEDPSLGWVGVRADLGAGGVHAALVPGSAEAAQALGSQMAGLHMYLNEQRTPVGSLTLAAPEASSAFSGANPGSSGNDHNPQQGDPAPTPTPASSSGTANERAGGATQATQQAMEQDLEFEPRTPLFECAGAYISVLA